MAKLIFVHERYMGQFHLLTEGKTTVGRGNQNLLVIPDASVSVEHCLILVNGPEVLITDLNSANGTYVDEGRIHGQCPVTSGQKVRFGEIETVLDLGESAEGTNIDEITAVWAHNRAMQQTPAALTPTQSAPLFTDSPADPDEVTVLLKSPLQRAPEQEQKPTPSRRDPPTLAYRSTSKVWMIVGALLGLAVLTVLVVWKRMGH